MDSAPELNPIGKLAQYYTEKPSLQALAQFLPGGGRMGTLLKIRAEEIAKERASIFFQELESGALELTPELIQSEDFVHRYVITAKAAANTFRHEKIRRFARLLQSSFKPHAVANTDEYEEYLQIIDELSDREYALLCILERHEKVNPFGDGPPKNTDYKDPQEYKDLKRAEKFWSQFLLESSQQLGIAVAQVQNMLTRLERTGCYQTLVSHLFFDKVHEEGKLTPTWFKIKSLVETQKPGDT